MQISFETTHNGDRFKLFYDEGLKLEIVMIYNFAHARYVDVNDFENRAYRFALDTRDNRHVASQMIEAERKEMAA